MKQNKASVSVLDQHTQYAQPLYGHYTGQTMLASIPVGFCWLTALVCPC